MTTCRLHAFPDTEAFARHLRRATGLGLAQVALHHFPDGESLIRIKPPAGDHAILVRSLHDPNTKLIETLLAADALRRAGARRVTLVAPYLPYMRQDTVFTPGEPISQKVIGSCLANAFDRVLTIEAHLHRVSRLSEAISCRAQSVSAVPAIAAWVKRTNTNTLVVGPDEESASWVRGIARAAQVPWIVGRKERLGDHRVRISFPLLPSSSRAVIIDDIASSGATLAVAARTLRRQGIATVEAVIVHAIFAPGALTRIHCAGIRTLVSCDTVPHSTNAIPSAPLVATSLMRGLR